MMSKAYPNYKPSGVEWLGDVPEHWEVKRTRFILSMNPSKQEINHLDLDTELAFLPMEAVSEEGSLRLDTTKPISEVSAGYTFFSEGDVTFAKITPCFENGKGAIMRNLGTDFGFGTTELTVMRPNKQLDAEYLYYLSVSDDFRHNGEAWMYGAGGQKRVPDEFVKEFRFGFPPLPEQQAIASFLDRETGRIDSLIAKKQRLLQLLAEQRTALISRAVTKGLDASVKLKPSGVEWLGDVPEHWEVKKLKHLTKMIIDNRGRTPEFGDEGIPMLEVKQITEGKRFPTNSFEKFVVESVVKQYERDKVIEGDILISTVGATSGKAVIVNKNPDYFIAQNVIGVRPISSVDNVFFYHSIVSDYFVNSLLSINKSNTIDNLKVSIFVNNYCLFPPLPEQQAIAAFLDRETVKIDTLSAKVGTVIEQLKEYRTALISSAVTGKIDVREAV